MMMFRGFEIERVGCCMPSYSNQRLKPDSVWRRRSFVNHMLSGIASMFTMETLTESM
ncbi:MAG: hypothetical protein QY310_15100 [Candidatus Jettenia sp. CY-1]|nr:MAG: hypothetical protein QY310_15100 [Candidatus Jettenia sp. CY-1]